MNEKNYHLIDTMSYLYYGQSAQMRSQHTRFGVFHRDSSWVLTSRAVKLWSLVFLSSGIITTLRCPLTSPAPSGLTTRVNLIVPCSSLQWSSTLSRYYLGLNMITIFNINLVIFPDQRTSGFSSELWNCWWDSPPHLLHSDHRASISHRLELLHPG